MKPRINKAVVLGAGNMGAQIAAHLANAGVEAWVLDVVPEALSTEEAARGLSPAHPDVRNRLALRGLENVKKSKPAALFLRENAERIRVGNLEDDLPQIADADWVIEAVVENLDVKRRLLARVDALRRPATLVSTNTSGLSISAMSEGCSEDFQRHFLGTHFFNPVRYMKLLELIPSPKTSPEVVAFVEEFCDRRLGKGIVYAQDTPNFIANRIGTFAALFTIHAMLRDGLTVEEVDQLTGPLIGHPKMASFRLADLVGVDVLLYVAENLFRSAAGDEMRETFRPPDFLKNMVDRRLLGTKTGQGFYKKVKNGGDSSVQVLDLATLEYRTQAKASFPGISAAQAIESTPQRLRALLSSTDRAGKFLWQTTAALLLYSARRIPEISADIVNIDRAMRWGYNWELGPFETWDAIGVRESVDRMRREGLDVPAVIDRFLAGGHTSFYQSVHGRRRYFDVAGATFLPIAEDPGILLLPALKERGKIVKSNTGATLLDLDDGVACLEFHSKMNAIGGDTISMLKAAVQEVEANFEGLVIGNQGENFSVGANLMLLLLESQEENWDEIDLIIRSFQNAAMALRYSSKPVVAAPFGMVLGGGCEICMATDRIRAAAETYMGLVEVGVGLIPAGSGCKEMVLRATELLPSGSDADFFPYLRRAFETVAMAKVATSGAEARQMGFLRRSDGITPNRDRLLQDAKVTVLDMVREGYTMPECRTDLVALGEPSLATLKLGVHMMLRGGYISEYDAHVGNKLAQVLTGGRQPRPTRVSEQHFLDLEREAFLSLCGERKTQQRMEHTLKTGKPLRN